MSYEGARLTREGLSLSPSRSDVMAADTRSVFLCGPNPLLVLLLQYILPPVPLQPDRVTILTSVAKSVGRAATEAELLHPQRYANFRERARVFCRVCTFRRAVIIMHSQNVFSNDARTMEKYVNLTF